MSEDKLHQQTIKITGVEQKLASNNSIYFNIKDENNKTYKLWKLIKDGSESKAYQAFKNFKDNGLGREIQVGVELQPGEYNGKPVTYRTIKSIGMTIPTQAAPLVVDTDINKLARDIVAANKLQITLLTSFTKAIEDAVKSNQSFLDDIIPDSDADNDVTLESIPF